VSEEILNGADVVAVFQGMRSRRDASSKADKFFI
jgi:hypothetical protein